MCLFSYTPFMASIPQKTIRLIPSSPYNILELVFSFYNFWSIMGLWPVISGFNCCGRDIFLSVIRTITNIHICQTIFKHSRHAIGQSEHNRFPYPSSSHTLPWHDVPGLKFPFSSLKMENQWIIIIKWSSSAILQYSPANKIRSKTFNSPNRPTTPTPINFSFLLVILIYSKSICFLIKLFS